MWFQLCPTSHPMCAALMVHRCSADHSSQPARSTSAGGIPGHCLASCNVLTLRVVGGSRAQGRPAKPHSIRHSPAMCVLEAAALHLWASPPHRQRMNLPPRLQTPPQRATLAQGRCALDPAHMWLGRRGLARALGGALKLAARARARLRVCARPRCVVVLSTPPLLLPRSPRLRAPSLDSPVFPL